MTTDKKREPALHVPPWVEMRELFENVDQRLFLDVLGRLGAVEPCTSLDDVEADEETDDDGAGELFSEMSSHTYDVIRLALYSLGVLRPTSDTSYSRDLMSRFLDVDPIAARAILAVVLACDQGAIKLNVASPKLIEAFKKIEALWHEGEKHTRWGTVQTRVMNDEELCEQALGFITHAKDMSAQAVLIEVTHRWLAGKGLKP